MAVGFRVFSNVLLRIKEFIVEYYNGCQPLTTERLKQDSKFQGKSVSWKQNWQNIKKPWPRIELN